MDGKHWMRFQSETSIFKFRRRSVDGKHWMRFQSETSIFKFLRRSMDGKHLMRFRSYICVFKISVSSVVWSGPNRQTITTTRDKNWLEVTCALKLINHGIWRSYRKKAVNLPDIPSSADSEELTWAPCFVWRTRSCEHSREWKISGDSNHSSWGTIQPENSANMTKNDSDQ